MTNTQHAKNVLAKQLPLEALPYIDDTLNALAAAGLLNSGAMDTIVWNDDVHRGMAAIDEDGETWIMQSEEDDVINLIHPETLAYVWGYKKHLTPTGTHHHFTPEPGHLTVLKTAKDYKTAPIGTIAAIDGYDPIIKSEDGWEDTDGEVLTDKESAELAIAERKVLRWGRNA